MESIWVLNMINNKPDIPHTSSRWNTQSSSNVENIVLSAPLSAKFPLGNAVAPFVLLRGEVEKDVHSDDETVEHELVVEDSETPRMKAGVRGCRFIRPIKICQKNTNSM